MEIVIQPRTTGSQCLEIPLWGRAAPASHATQSKETGVFPQAGHGWSSMQPSQVPLCASAIKSRRCEGSGSLWRAGRGYDMGGRVHAVEEPRDRDRCQSGGRSRPHLRHRPPPGAPALRSRRAPLQPPCPPFSRLGSPLPPAPSSPRPCPVCPVWPHLCPPCDSAVFCMFYLLPLSNEASSMHGHSLTP